MARPKAQLTALHLAQHQHDSDGDGRVRFSLLSEHSPQAPVVERLVRSGPGFQLPTRRQLAHTSRAVDSVQGGIRRHEVFLRFVVT